MARGATIVSLVGMQTQFVALLAKLSLPWPNEWMRIMQALEIFNLDPRKVLGARDLPVIDFRALFIIVANLIPIAVTVLMLVLFQPVGVVAWYTVTAACFVATIAGIIIRFMEGLTVGIWLAGGGGFLFVLCCIVGVVSYLYRHVDDDKKLAMFGSSLKREQEAKRAEKLKLNQWRTLKYFVVSTVCLVGGCILNGFFVDVGLRTHAEESTLQAVGYTLLVISGIAVFYFLFSLSVGGRHAIYKLHSFLSANTLMSMLVLISVVYVPVITYTINIFMCATYECPAQSRFNPHANRDAESYSTSPAIFCDSCVFLDSRCSANGTNPANAAAVCPAFSTYRVWKSPEVQCRDGATLFYYVSAIFVLPIFVVVIPVMYYILIVQITTIINNEVALVPEEGENLDHVAPVKLYERRVYAVEPAASSLYQPFRWHMRHTSIALLMFQLTVVLVTNILAPYASNVAIFVLMGVHTAATVFLVVQRPFISAIEHWLSVSCTSLNVLNAIYAAVVTYSVALPGWVAYVVIGLNVVVPLLAALYGFKFVRNKTKESSKGKKMLRRARTYEKLRKKRDRVTRPGVGDNLAALLLASGENYQSEDGGRGGDDDDDAEELETRSLERRVSSLRVGGSGGPVLDIERAESEHRTAKELEVLLAVANERNTVVTKGINERTSEMMTRFFMGMGIALLIALGASVLGYLRGESSSFVDGSSSLQRSTQFVLGGYESWVNFTNSCCCVAAHNPPTAFKRQERWLCDNGITVDRGRVDASGVSGLMLRPFCGREFNALFGCEVAVLDRIVSLECRNATELILAEVSDKALALLW